MFASLFDSYIFLYIYAFVLFLTLRYATPYTYINIFIYNSIVLGRTEVFDSGVAAYCSPSR